jgi:hypothetical protein
MFFEFFNIDNPLARLTMAVWFRTGTDVWNHFAVWRNIRNAYFKLFLIGFNKFVLLWLWFCLNIFIFLAEFWVFFLLWLIPDFELFIFILWLYLSLDISQLLLAWFCNFFILDWRFNFYQTCLNFNWASISLGVWTNQRSLPSFMTAIILA